MEEKDLFHPVSQGKTSLVLSDETSKRFREAQDAVAQQAAGSTIVDAPGYNVIVTPLGTSSAVPTKYRNGRSSAHIFCMGICPHYAL